MWKIQQAKQDDAEFTRRIHPALKPVTGLKRSCAKILQPANRDPGWKNRNFGNRANPPYDMNKSEVRRDLGNRDHWEEAFTYPYLPAFAYLFKLLTRDFIILSGGISRRNPTVA